MAITKTPPNPIPATYRPPGGLTYRVEPGDDWKKIANRLGIDVWDLIAFNFKTRDPAEVNWYLYRNVGCRNTTADGKNYVFRGASPGIIYLPPARAGSVNTNTGVWFGVGATVGGHLGVAGRETMQAWVVSADDYDSHFHLDVSSWRVGPGLGGSVGANLVIVAACLDPLRLHGFQVHNWNWDTQISFGKKWGDVLKVIRSWHWVRQFANNRGMRVAAGIISRSEWHTAATTIKDAVGVLQLDLEAARPQVATLPVPGAGWGLELSVYRKYGMAQVHSIHAN